jgi:hypothetical protein
VVLIELEESRVGSDLGYRPSFSIASSTRWHHLLQGVGTAMTTAPRRGPSTAARPGRGRRAAAQPRHGKGAARGGLMTMALDLGPMGLDLGSRGFYFS